MSSSSSSEPAPPVDERLVAPGTRYEIEDGRVVYVPPADEPHGMHHAELAALVKAHRADGFAVAVDMLTRLTRIDDIAPDVSIYPAARNPDTGGRQLEHIAFEVCSTESLGHAAARAAKLVARGVRRVFAIDVERARVLEWSPTLDAWSILDARSSIEDAALAVPLEIAALLDAAVSDGAIARAYRQRRHPEFLAERAEGREEGIVRGREEGVARGREEGVARGREEGREEGRAQGLALAAIAVLEARGLVPTDTERQRVLDERAIDSLERWVRAAATCASVAALFDRTEETR